MKKHLLFLMVPAVLLSTRMMACIDPDSVVQVIVNYDTLIVDPCAYADEVEIRLTNIRLMNEDPNKICACALSSFENMFSELRYVAFVDSGTNNPYLGFAQFMGNLASSSAWDNSQPGFGGWSGFIADVINGGLQSTHPVELVIRAEAPPNTIVNVDTNCTVGSTMLLGERLAHSSLGTDAWDEANQTLDESHQSVRSFDPTLVPGSSMTQNLVDSVYFATLDSAILNNYPVDTTLGIITVEGLAINIYPNPASEFLTIRSLDDSRSIEAIELLTINGRVVRTWNPRAQMRSLSLENVDAGIYFVRLQVDGEVTLSRPIVVAP